MKVDFYVLEANRQKSLFFACRLIEKAYAEEQKVFIYTHSAEEAEQMDNVLWTYREDSFLPHNMYDPSDVFPPPIQIGFADEVPAQQQDILINLNKTIPPFYHQFKRVIEIVFSDPLMQQLARERYKYYRDQGYELSTHKLKANEL